MVLERCTNAVATPFGVTGALTLFNVSFGVIRSASYGILGLSCFVLDISPKSLCLEIPLLHYDHESHESPRINNFLDSWLNRYQFMKFLAVSYIHVFVVSSDQSGIRGKSFELFKVLATNSRFQNNRC